MKSKRMRVGQSLIEFALILPLFFFMVTVFLDLGRASFSYSTLNNAVREGNRFAIVQAQSNYASLTALNAAVEAKIRTYLYTNDLNNNSTITITRLDVDTDPKIKIDIVYKFKPVTPGLSQIMGKGKTLTITVESVMRTAPIAN
jgi:Flp pilus assembly protein TadG